MADPYVFNLGRAFAGIAARHADRPALRPSGAADCSYADLAAAVASMAPRLKGAGAGRCTLVALQHGKSREGYAAMLACLCIGAAYVNLDPQNPMERLRRILAVCRPCLVLCDDAPGPALADAAAAFGVRVLTLAELAAVPPVAVTADDSPSGSEPAYVMFTSGSTGVPKGVAVSHASVLNFIDWSRSTFDIRPDDVLAGASPVYFDNSVFDFYASLFTGACLAPLGAGDLAQAPSVVRRVDAAGCTVWFSVPSLLIFLTTMRALDGDAFARVRTIVFGGEGYPKTELAKLSARLGDRARLFNVYGPTECTCICSAHQVTAADLADPAGLPPLGRIAENVGWRILDGDAPVAAGEAGELCLSGPQVALGYWNDAERSRAAFVPDPLSPMVPQPMYRTGDLVREQDGLLHFVGRRDNQIKHMGYRIELDEIEAAINALPYVTQAAVTYRRIRDGFGHIVAHVAAGVGAIDAGGAVADEARLRDDLRPVLPAYMLPNRVVFLSDLPKNANGKVDRVRLRDA